MIAIYKYWHICKMANDEFRLPKNPNFWTHAAISMQKVLQKYPIEI